MIPYPKLMNLSDDHEIWSVNCYFFEKQKPGYTTSVINGVVTLTDWCLNSVDSSVITSAAEYIDRTMYVFDKIDVHNYQVFFNNKNEIVDVVCSDKILTHGTIKSLFGDIIPIAKAICFGTLAKSRPFHFLEGFTNVLVKPAILRYDGENILYANLQKTQIGRIKTIVTTS